VTLRPDERHAVEEFVQHLSSIYEDNLISWKTPEKDPPDVDMKIDGIYYAVEITTIPEVYTLGLSKPINSKAVVGSVQGIVKKIETQAIQRGILTGQYYISFYSPKPPVDFNAKDIIKQALDYIEQTQDQKSAEKHVIAGNRFKHAWIRKTGNDQPFVHSPTTPALADFPEDIIPSCKALEHVLDDKAFMADWSDPAILLILHDPTMRPAAIYRHCNHLQAKLEKFHTVFIVSNPVAGTHQMLWSKIPDWLAL
jgi:hypothetical protein